MLSPAKSSSTNRRCVTGVDHLLNRQEFRWFISPRIHTCDTPSPTGVTPRHGLARRLTVEPPSRPHGGRDWPDARLSACPCGLERLPDLGGGQGRIDVADTPGR